MSPEGTDGLDLRLFVSGATPSSLRAISILRKLCQEHLGSRFTLEVIDVYRDPEAARKYQIVALPALLKMAPRPKRLFVGDLSNIAPLVVEFDAFVNASEQG